MNEVAQALSNTEAKESEHLFLLLGDLLRPTANYWYPEFDNVHELLEAIHNTEWAQVHSLVRGVKDPTIRVYRGPLPGLTRRIHFMFLPDDVQFELRKINPDNPSSRCDLVIMNPKKEWSKVGYSTILTSSGVTVDSSVIWAVHTGPELEDPKRLPTKWHGTQIDKEQARKMGFSWAKIPRE